MDKNAVKIIKRQRSFDGFLQLDEVTLQHPLFEGGMTPVIKRELLVRPDAIVALPYDPARQQVVLNRQFRLGAYDRGHDPWLYEVVAGIVEPNESYSDALTREMREETGLSVIQAQQMYAYYSSPGSTSEYIMAYCVCVDSTQAKSVAGVAGEHEDIKVDVMSVEAALNLLAQGVIINVNTILALQWLQLNQSQLFDI